MDQRAEEKQLRYQAIQRVTIVGVLVNLVLAVSKTSIGFIAQSQSLVADGIHSLSDLLSDALVFFASKHAHQGPDEDHPYGHGRFETAGTLGLGLLLALVAIGITWDAVERLFSPEALLHPKPLALYAALFSILANEWLYHYTARVARRIKSDLLQANAWHHRSDALSSIVVLVGVAGTMAGLPYLDAIAAIGVGLMIAKIGWDLSWPAFQELVDEGLDEDRLEKIRGIICHIGGVQDIHMLRTRRIGGEATVDVHILVEPWLSVSEGHMIGQTVIDRLLEGVSEVMDVTVHIDPEDDEIAIPCEGLPLRAAAEKLLEQQWTDIPGADRRKRVVFHYLEGKIGVDVYFSLDDLAEPEILRAFQQTLEERALRRPEFGAVRVYYG
ncbi:cation diffusion facilitator family transporter [Sedimenticola selenatireducens]|uniref:Cation transporter n=1 Tax=Sedimenticola selenatireducens TaxID=191960 RepID=A0A557SHH9_9GAMM|nr:cation diffusion facilitator family transporter [Sedimenticola selenatireducens]TVO76854.1 cation transporter [Sedimenticola selenatireducens]TVT64297.1 MAG: cation transporter [Sedimenticola selenatireducens]